MVYILLVEQAHDFYGLFRNLWISPQSDAFERGHQGLAEDGSCGIMCVWVRYTVREIQRY